MGLPLPNVVFEDEPYWTGGREGQLLIGRCGSCRLWVHPLVPRCPGCGEWEVQPEPASGEGIVYTFTVNRQPWLPDVGVPYALALVDLPEQDGLRVVTRLVDVDVDQVSIGMPVRVRFEQVEENTWVPVFAPAVDAEGGSR